MRSQLSYEIEKQNSLSDENNQLKEEIKALRLDQEKQKHAKEQKHAVNDVEQYRLRKCLHQWRILQEDEDVEAIVIAIGKGIGVKVGKSNMTVCHIMKKAKGDQLIITKFLNRKIKKILCKKEESENKDP